MRVSKNKLSVLKGFSLLEVVVAMGLFSVGLLSIIQLQLQAYSVIADSALKSQALAYASSRQEIHTLEHAQSLSKKWEKDIHLVLPNLHIASEIGDDNNLSLLLSWETSQINVGCLSQGIQDRDCLQL